MPKSQCEYTTVAKQEKPKESLWRPNTWEPTTAFTAILAFMAVGQAGLFFWQLGLIRLGAEDTKALAAAAAEQTRLTRDEFNATHRPRLTVRNVTINLADAARKDGSFLGFLRVVNIGGSPAKIVESHVMIDWRIGALPMVRPYDGVAPNNRFVGMLLPGQSRSVQFGDGDTSQDVQSMQAGGSDRRSVMGYFVYEDASGTRRRTAFCREFDQTASRFGRSGNEDYEHEE